MTARGLVCILQGNPFYLYIANLTAKPAKVPKFVIVRCVPIGPTGIIHAREDTPCMMEDEGPTPKQSDIFKSHPTTNAVRHSPPEHFNDQLVRQNDIEESNEVPNPGWRK